MGVAEDKGAVLYIIIQINGITGRERDALVRTMGTIELGICAAEVGIADVVFRDILGVLEDRVTKGSVYEIPFIVALHHIPGVCTAGGQCTGDVDAGNGQF